jgi:glutathione synthase/RimK-type ligase-like ATP-grasp enzyme
MKNVYVIGSKNSGTKNDPAVIAASINSEVASAKVIYWEDLLFKIQTSNVEIFAGELNILENKPDLIIALGWYKNGDKSIYRDIAFSFALYLRKNNIEFWNSEMLAQRSISKLSCMVQLALEGIPVPTTYFCLDLDRLTQQIEKPYIIKALATSRGKSNYLINNDEDLAPVYSSKEYFIVQNFLKNDHDLRLVCFGGKPRLALKRSRKADAQTHLNNVSQGADAQWLDFDSLDPLLLTKSEKICNITQREMAGIDFIPDESSDFGYSCLEVNAIPQLTSGTDVDKKMSALLNALNEERNL